MSSKRRVPRWLPNPSSRRRVCASYTLPAEASHGQSILLEESLKKKMFEQTVSPSAKNNEKRRQNEASKEDCTVSSILTKILNERHVQRISQHLVEVNC